MVVRLSVVICSNYSPERSSGLVRWVGGRRGCSPPGPAGGEGGPGGLPWPPRSAAPAPARSAASSPTTCAPPPALGCSPSIRHGGHSASSETAVAPPGGDWHLGGPAWEAPRAPRPPPPPPPPPLHCRKPTAGGCRPRPGHQVTPAALTSRTREGPVAQAEVAGRRPGPRAEPIFFVPRRP